MRWGESCRLGGPRTAGRSAPGAYRCHGRLCGLRTVPVPGPLVRCTCSTSAAATCVKMKKTLAGRRSGGVRPVIISADDLILDPLSQRIPRRPAEPPSGRLDSGVGVVDLPGRPGWHGSAAAVPAGGGARTSVQASTKGDVEDDRPDLVTCRCRCRCRECRAGGSTQGGGADDRPLQVRPCRLDASA